MRLLWNKISENLKITASILSKSSSKKSIERVLIVLLPIDQSLCVLYLYVIEQHCRYNARC